VIISWSAATDELAAKTRALLDELVPTQPTVEHQSPLSQFSHYHHICDALNTRRFDAGATWICFSEDDDLWHPHRLQFYYLVAQRANPNPKITNLRTPWSACLNEAAATVDGKKPRRPRNAADVDELIASGVVTLFHDPSHLSQDIESEYWHQLTKLHVLSSFMRIAPRALLACRFCDVAWEAFARQFQLDEHGAPLVSGWMHITIPYHPASPWMYYVTLPDAAKADVHSCPFGFDHSAAMTLDDGGHALSLTVDPTPAEKLLSQVVLPNLLHKFPHSEHNTVERLWCKVAHLRYCLSLTLCQRLWPARFSATPAEMVNALIYHLQQFWEKAPWQEHDRDDRDKRERLLDEERQDCYLIIEARCLRPLLADLELPVEIAERFEAFARGRRHGKWQNNDPLADVWSVTTTGHPSEIGALVEKTLTKPTRKPAGKRHRKALQ